jgi:hypothetical protein
VLAAPRVYSDAVDKACINSRMAMVLNYKQQIPQGHTVTAGGLYNNKCSHIFSKTGNFLKVSWRRSGFQIF